MLLRIEDIDCLIHPRDGTKIETDEGYLKCEGQPVLIDFQQSIFKEESYHNYEGFVHRRQSKVWKFFSQLVNGDFVKQNKPPYFYLSNYSDQPTPRVLVIGGATVAAGLEQFYEGENIETISFDVYPSPSTSFVADAHNIPVESESVDFVIIQNVLEHVVDPGRVVSEIWRVLKDSGIVFAESPFLAGVHEGAYDFFRFSESAHRLLFSKFERLDSGCARGVGTTLIWSLSAFITGLFRSRMIGRLSKFLYFWLQLFNYVVDEKHNVDGALEVFFVGRKQSGYKPESIIEYYRGSQ